MSMLDAPAGDVAAYAADVRRALSDLTPEQVDDLTDDLEIALADAMADDGRAGAGPGLVGMFGAPEQYAAELRAAAGLAPGSSRKQRPGDAWVRLRSWARGELGPLYAQAWWPPFADFMRTLAPLWWVLRAWVMYGLLCAFFGVSVGSVTSWPALAAFVVVSVQWGRGRWRSNRLVRVVWRATSAVALVAALPILATAGNGSGSGAPVQWTPSAGVYVDDSPVANLFVYDGDGNPVPNAQVYDDQGRPVQLSDPDQGTQDWYDEANETWMSPVPATEADGRQRWNVYPLRVTSTDESDARVVDVPWPFAQAGAVPMAPSTMAPSTTAPGTTAPGATAPGATAPATTMAPDATSSAASSPAAGSSTGASPAKPTPASAPVSTPATTPAQGERGGPVESPATPNS